MVDHVICQTKVLYLKGEIQMVNNNQNTQNVNNQGMNLPANAEQQKQSRFKAAGDAAFKKWQAFKTSKVGRWGLRLVKGTVLAAGGYFCYREGQKSIKPTTVYVQENKTVEPAEQEPEQVENQTETTEA